ncbi:MAG: IS4 family transposase [Shimia sp.]|nr:IS4 family transposase [Shimia sp.]
MNRHLRDTLVGTLSSHLDLSKSRLETLALLILGLVNSRTVNLSHGASQFSGTALIPSSYRRLQRFFQYVRLDGDWVAQLTVKWLRIRPPWILCLDRTNWKIGRSDVNILMLAISTRRMRIPLMWTLLPTGGCSNQGERISLMRRYLAIFGPDSISWLLADREFIGATWVKFLLENNIVFCIRVKENSVICLEDGHTYQLNSLLRTRRNAKQILAQPGRLAAMIDCPGLPLTFDAKRLRDGELLIVATNGPTKKALNTYKKRWQIECLFGDSKTRGLNMEDTRLTDHAKLNTLLIVITLAMTWAYATATISQAGAAIKKRAHGYRSQSWFRLGFDRLRNWILHHPQKAAAAWTRAWPKRRIKPKTARVV